MNEFQTALSRFLSGQLDFPGLEAALVRTLQEDPASAEISLQSLEHLFRTSRLPAQIYIALKQKIPIGQEQTPLHPLPDQQAGEEPPQTPTGSDHSQTPAQPQSQDIPDVVSPESTDPTTLSEHVQKLPLPVPSAAGEPTGGASERPPARDPGSAAEHPSSDILDILQPAESGAQMVQLPGQSAADSSVTGAEAADQPPAEDKTIFVQSAPPRPAAGQQSVPHSGAGSYSQSGRFTGHSGGMSIPTGGTGAGTGSNWTDPSRWGSGPAPTMQPGSVLKDRYVLEVVIGRGGMGVVFKAKDLRREEAQDRNPYVAVKILNDEFRRHPESLKALQRESRKAQDLAHPNIVTVFDFDRDGPIVFMTMEFLEGRSLDRISKSATFDGMPMNDAYPLTRAMGQALGHAHGKGIVHSDFKPANVFLTDTGIVKIFDFGIARAAKLPDDKSGDMTLFDPGSLGALTPAYASCQMLDGEEPDARDDIYALACVTYELLTGKHPFGKRSAADARDKNIVLVAIKGITRRQWRGIQRGLAFQQEKRSPNVDTFLEDLRPRKINKTSAALAVAAAAAIVAIGIVFVPSQLAGRRVNILIAAITTSVDAEIPTVLGRLDDLNAEEQGTVKGNGGVRNRLVDFFTSQITTAVGELDYPRAQGLVDLALEMYPDSAGVAQANTDLGEARDALLADLLSQFNAHLEAGSILPSDGDDITDILEIYEKADPTNDSLTDPRLASAYAAAARAALATDIGLAERYLTAWQQRFPGDAQYAGLRDSANNLRDVQNRDLRVAELQEQLTQQFPALNAPEDVLAVENELLQLETLAPTDELVDTYRRRAQDLTSARVGEMLDENDWLGANQLLTQLQRIIGPEYRSAAMTRISDAESAYTGRIGSMLVAVTQAVQNREFAQAEERLAQLLQQGAAAGTLREARATISRGYLDQARTERTANNFDNATALIRAGQSADPEFTNWPLELSAIADAARILAEGLADEEINAREQQRLASIDELTGRIRANLALEVFGIDSARETLAWIDELGRLDPSANLSTIGRSEVASNLVVRATAIGYDENLWDESLALVTQAIELLPGENALRQIREQLQMERSRFLADVAVAEEENLRANIDSLLAAPTYDSDWESELRTAVQSLEPLADSSDNLVSTRREIAQAYVGQAESLFVENRFDLAERMLNSSEWFIPDFDPALAVRERLATARTEFEAESKERELIADINGLKRTFETELNAERIPDARNALVRLQDLLPPNDEFLASEAPQFIADTFYRMAARALDERRFDDAEGLVRQGLREVANYPVLTSQLADIVSQRLEDNVSKLENIIQMASTEDAAQPKNILEKVKEDAGPGFAEIDSNLREIAAKRVSDSGSNRDAVVNWISSIFDGFVAAPTLGTSCTSNLAGSGKRVRAQCYDFLPDGTTQGPRLVVVPPGNDIAEPFAIARQEITVRQWNDYCRFSGNCTLSTMQDDQVPITNITLDQALTYATWLSSNTNHVYRLPTDAEWVYAANADGREAARSPNCRNTQSGNPGDRLFVANTGGQNTWGIRGYLGNAQEWVTVPTGGYLARGGAYNDRIGNCIVDFSRPHDGAADDVTGFRLVRELGEGA